MLLEDEPDGGGEKDGIADDVDRPSAELVGQGDPEEIARSLGQVRLGWVSFSDGVIYIYIYT